MTAGSVRMLEEGSVRRREEELATAKRAERTAASAKRDEARNGGDDAAAATADGDDAAAATAAAAALVDVEAKREMGLVAVLKDTYGFIKCCERDHDVFFHYSALECERDEVALNSDVEFTVVHDGRAAKPIAVKIRPAEKGSAVFEDVEEEVLRGHCVEKLPNVKSYGNDSRRDDKGMLEYGDDEPRATIPFARADLADARVQPKLGDLVTFRIVTQRRNGEKRATHIENVSFTGTVVTMKAAFGFLEYHDANEVHRVYFHASEVLDKADLKPRDECRFFVMYKSTGSKELNARRVVRTKEAPASTVKEVAESGEEERPERLRKFAKTAQGSAGEGAIQAVPQGTIKPGPEPGSKGFAFGRGVPLKMPPLPKAPPPSGLSSTAEPFVPGGAAPKDPPEPSAPAEAFDLEP